MQRTPACPVWRWLWIALIALLAATPGASTADRTDFDSFLARRFAETSFPGLAVAVTGPNDVIHLGGYGEAGPDRPMTAETPLRVGSLSKSFTAVAVLQLVEQGKVALDSPVKEYLPDFRVADEAATGAITVRHLLHHISGLADSSFPELWDLDQADAAQRVASLAGARTVAEPGTEYHYFNPNYEILARLVEVVDGRSFNQYLTDEVFRPLGMDETVAVTRSEHASVEVPDLASGHILLFGGSFGAQEPEGFVAGSAGVISTAADLAIWLRTQLNDGDVGGHRVLNRDSVVLSRTPPAGVDSDYGMGWWRSTIGGHQAIEHNGVLATAYAEQLLLPAEGYGIVLLANANHVFNDVPAIKREVVDFLTGSRPAGGGLAYRHFALIVAVAGAVGLAGRLVQLRRRRQWAEKTTGSPWSRFVGIARLSVPGVVLLFLPFMVAVGSGRYFPHSLLFYAMPELIIWLAIATVMAVALGIARLTATRHGSPPPGEKAVQSRR